MSEKHIIEEGSLEHVVSYRICNGKAKEICSEPNCEINDELDKKAEENK